MKEDLPRAGSSRANRFVGVTPQQGRVETDADFNEAADLLARYLAAHPGADDTLEGISRWWLPQAEGRLGQVPVQSALAALIARGLVSEERHPDGRVHYRRRVPS
jgi:hypothetical protein